MGLITPAHNYKLIDKLVAVYQQFLGSGSLGAGDGTFGASLKAVDISNLVSGSSDSSFCDPDIQQPLLGVAARLSGQLTTQTLFGAVASNFIDGLAAVSSLARSVNFSIVDLDSYMSWYNYANGLTYWQCLAPPDWYYIYSAVRPGLYPSPRNMYFPCKQGATVLGSTFTNALWKKVIGGADTNGFTIDYTKWGGGFAYITWTGGAGSGAVSITATGLDDQGAVGTWTASGTWGVGSFVATNTGILLTPGTANARITDVTAVSVSGMSAGTCYVEAREPAGRNYPPV